MNKSAEPVYFDILRYNLTIHDIKTLIKLFASPLPTVMAP